MAPVRCHYHGCVNTSATKSVFTFPINDERRLNLWIKHSGNANLAMLTHQELKHRFICEDHFEAVDVLKHFARSRLVPTAVPLMYSPVTSQCGNDSEHDNVYECRACLQSFNHDAGLIDLFQPWSPPWVGSMRKTIAEDLAKFAEVKISIKDALSRFICQVCHQKLLEACRFAASVYENDQVLRRKINMDAHQKVCPSPMQVKKSVDKIVFEDPLAIDVKQEPPTDDETYGEMDECMRQDMEPSTEIDTANLDIKVEPEEIEQPQLPITVNGNNMEAEEVAPQSKPRTSIVRTGFKHTRCWMCAQRKVTARTIWKCLECNTNLCIDTCFMQYHM